tara:strand:- start:405 stop:770 length:366 start_codon:yes stop_codon:yes gene_type:complete
MKKFLALLLLSPFVVSEEVEYPIELTCVNGTNIIYISMAQKTDDSWISVGQSYYFGKTNKKFKVKIEKKKNFIAFTSKRSGPLTPITVIMNTYTLAASIGDGTSSRGGQCYKGFKEYEKQI